MIGALLAGAAWGGPVDLGVVYAPRFDAPSDPWEARARSSVRGSVAWRIAPLFAVELEGGAWHGAIYTDLQILSIVSTQAIIDLTLPKTSATASLRFTPVFGQLQSGPPFWVDLLVGTGVLWALDTNPEPQFYQPPPTRYGTLRHPTLDVGAALRTGARWGIRAELRHKSWIEVRSEVDLDLTYLVLAGLGLTATL